MTAPENGHDQVADRSWDEVLADAIRVLTEAARLRRPVMQQNAGGGWEPHPLHTEPADWAEFVTLAAAGAAANIGSIDRTLEGRPGSWEADAVRGMLLATVGEDPAELLRHRTEPIRVVLRPAEILSDLARRLSLRWNIAKPWYGFSWAMRPLKARVLGKREPSKFYLLWARIEG